jgi:hypothetical protein
VLNVHVRIVDAATKQPTAARVCVAGPRGECFAPLGYDTYLPTGIGEALGAGVKHGADCWYAIDGGCEIALPAETPLRIRILKGIEFQPYDATVLLKPGQMTLRFELNRTLDLSSQGWHAIDPRCHEIDPISAQIEAAAEDLTAVNLLVRKRPMLGLDGNTYPTTHYLAGFSGQAAIHAASRVWINTLNTHPVLGKLALTSHRPVHPLAFGGLNGPDDWSLLDWCDQAHRKGGLVTWIDAFRGDEPLPGGEALVAAILGKVDAIEYDGRARPQPFLPWFYRLWNAGIPLALVGASGKDSNRRSLGAMRTYIHGDAANWPAAVRAGKCTITNGPWLTCEIENGSIIARVSSHTPFDRLEIIVDGTVVAMSAGTGELSAPVLADAAGWFAARVVGGPCLLDPAQTLFAHTSPRSFGPARPRRRAYTALLKQCLHKLLEWSESQAHYEKPNARIERFERCQTALSAIETNTV